MPDDDAAVIVNGINLLSIPAPDVRKYAINCVVAIWPDDNERKKLIFCPEKNTSRTKVDNETTASFKGKYT